MRIGTGYDVHKFQEGRPLILGGVTIPYEKGLLGHSDADVLIHAIMDSLLGACALGDIGKHFPDTDSTYSGISSLILLSRVNELIQSKGYLIENIDSTIIAQVPKLAPYIPDMVQNISTILGIEENQINVKATTEEGLGFTGRKEGISARAVCLLHCIRDEVYSLIQGTPSNDSSLNNSTKNNAETGSPAFRCNACCGCNKTGVSDK